MGMSIRKGPKTKPQAKRNLAVNMSAVRWGLAAALAVAALVAATRSLGTYQAHQMTTGLLAVVALAILLVVGLASLGIARLRIGRELAGLRAGQNGQNGSDGKDASELLASRRARLDHLHASGARPDRQALAEVTRAEEAGRAYIGRYLVATTVLIGLVGTFAGLMQTLGNMAPLFADQGRAGDITLLAGPLGGLQVTFGASLVAILATLALALAQGDLALGEEQALALLEDRTTHQLIPALWPAATGDVADRLLGAVEDLKAVFAGSFAKTIETSLKNVADTVRGQIDLSTGAWKDLGATVEKQLGTLGAKVDGLMGEVAERARLNSDAVTQALTQAADRQTLALAQSADKITDRLGAAAADVVGRAAAAVEEFSQSSARAVVDANQRSATALEQSAQRSTALLEQSSQHSTAALEEASQRFAALIQQVLDQSTQSAAALMRGTSEATQALMRGTTEATQALLSGTTEATEAAARAAAESVARTLDPLFAGQVGQWDGLRTALGEVGTRIDATGTRLVELTSSLDGTAREHIGAMDRNGQALLAAFDRTVVGGGAALQTASAALAAAARDLQRGTETLAPRLGAMTTELAAMSREVALLLAARGPESDLGAVVLGELDRLGAGMDRLAELVRLAEGKPVTAPQPASEDGPAQDVAAVSAAVVEITDEFTGELESELEDEGVQEGDPAVGSSALAAESAFGAASEEPSVDADLVADLVADDETAR